MTQRLQSDRLAVVAGDSPDPAVVPFRGEYLALAEENGDAPADQSLALLHALWAALVHTTSPGSRTARSRSTTSSQTSSA